MKFINTFLFGLIISLTSCGNLTDKKEEQITEADLIPIQVNNEYSLSVPKYMTEAKNLNEEASLQYQNIFKETYVIVIDEDKETFINTFVDANAYDSTLSVTVNYQNAQLQSFSENMTVTSQQDPVSWKLNGLEAQHVQMTGKVEGVKKEIVYYLTFVEGKDKLYMIMAWTLKDRKEKYGKTMEVMSKTFRLI